MNFVIIMTDTQNRDMVGAYGNNAVNTPSLDRLAADGIRFSSRTMATGRVTQGNGISMVPAILEMARQVAGSRPNGGMTANVTLKMSGTRYLRSTAPVQPSIPNVFGGTAWPTGPSTS